MVYDICAKRNRSTRGFATVIAVLLLTCSIFAGAVLHASAASKTADYIKVGLRFASSETTASFATSGGFTLCSVSGDTIRTDSSVDLSGYNTVVFTLSGGNVVICDSSGNAITVIKSDGTQAVAPIKSFSDNTSFTFNGTAYRGAVMPYINSAGQMNIINYTDVEDYVKGVVNKEIGGSAGIEAKKAQAVTARSYVKANEGMHSSEGFDVCCGTHCQVFAGVAGESDSSNEAVDATKGQLLYYDGKVVRGYYFANSGGHTANSEDVWYSPLGYTRGIVDKYSPNSEWEVEYTRAELTKAFESKNIGTVNSITINGFDNGGYVSSITVNGSIASTTYSKDGVRSFTSGIASLKSRMFTIDTNGGTLVSNGTAAATTTQNSGFYVRGADSFSQLGDTLFARDSIGSSQLSLGGMSILDGSGNIVKASGSSSSSTGSASTMTVILNKDTDSLIISGRGSGHGVGMSQDGAIAMAKEGYSYIDILNYYYTNIEVK